MFARFKLCDELPDKHFTWLTSDIAPCATRLCSWTDPIAMCRVRGVILGPPKANRRNQTGESRRNCSTSLFSFLRAAKCSLTHSDQKNICSESVEVIKFQETWSTEHNTTQQNITKQHEIHFHCQCTIISSPANPQQPELVQTVAKQNTGLQCFLIKSDTAFSTT